MVSLKWSSTHVWARGLEKSCKLNYCLWRVSISWDSHYVICNVVFVSKGDLFDVYFVTVLKQFKGLYPQNGVTSFLPWVSKNHNSSFVSHLKLCHSKTKWTSGLVQCAYLFSRFSKTKMKVMFNSPVKAERTILKFRAQWKMCKATECLLLICKYLISKITELHRRKFGLNHVTNTLIFFIVGRALWVGWTNTQKHYLMNGSHLTMT